MVFIGDGVIPINEQIDLDDLVVAIKSVYVKNDNPGLTTDDSCLPCTIRDLSVSGARVRLTRLIHDQKLHLDVPGVGSLACELSRTIDPLEMGIRFIDPGPRRDALIRKVYTGVYDNGTRQAAPGRLFIAVLKRIFGRDPL